MRFSFSIEVWDNEKQTHLVNEAFGTSGVFTIVDYLKRTIAELESVTL